MDVKVEVSFKNSVMRIEVDGTHVDSVFVGDDVGDLVGHSLPVESADVNMGQVGEDFELVPGGLDDVFTPARHQFDCFGTCFSVDDNLFAFRHKAYHIVARYWVAAGCQFVIGFA